MQPRTAPPPRTSSPSLAEIEPLLAMNLRRYRMVERVATGSMGIVYRAVDRRLARTVALKVLRTDVSHRSKGLKSAMIARARFIQEARAMARLAHPNVVPIYAIENVGPHLVIAMEYVPGVTLAQWLAEPRRWQDVLAVMRAAADGLAAAHSAGFVHRDFKPHNVLIGDDGRVRVTDFGLAMLQADNEPITDDDRMDGLLASGAEHAAVEPLESLTQTGMSVGTPAYMAPEQHAGGTIDARTDQYGFCAALYEALYGVRPFIGCDAVELMRAKKGMRLIAPLRRCEVPKWLERVVLRGLSPDSTKRFSSMRALLAAMQPPKKRPWLGGLSVGLGLAGFAAGLTFMVLPPRASAEAATIEAPITPRVKPLRAAVPGPIAMAEDHIAAGEWERAERLLASAYFGAIADARFADAIAAADLLAIVHVRSGSPRMAGHWRGHAEAARRRAARDGS
jgi:tRNA A-37 threonylcarbamoyl transferase component Bud32